MKLNSVSNHIACFVQPIINVNTHRVIGFEVLLRSLIDGCDSKIGSPQMLLNADSPIDLYNTVTQELLTRVQEHLDELTTTTGCAENIFTSFNVRRSNYFLKK